MLQIIQRFTFLPVCRERQECRGRLPVVGRVGAQTIVSSCKLCNIVDVFLFFFAACSKLERRSRSLPPSPALIAASSSLVSRGSRRGWGQAHRCGSMRVACVDVCSSCEVGGEGSGMGRNSGKPRGQTHYTARPYPQAPPAARPLATEYATLFWLLSESYVC